MVSSIQTTFSETCATTEDLVRQPESAYCYRLREVHVRKSIEQGGMNALRLKQRLWVQFPYKPEVFSSLIYIIVQVVFIVAKAAFIPYLIYWPKAISLCGEKGENVHKKDTISLRRQIWLSLAQVLNRNNDWVGTVKSTSLVAVIREGESALYIKICTLMNEVNPEDEVYLKFMYRTISRYVFTED